MQRSVFESWISDLHERGFDTPLLQLLRSHEYYDIQFTHGQYEFGKDFQAKRREDGTVVQYVFQSKAGDIGGSEWDSIFGQLFEAAGGRLAHPNFDASAKRCCVLVTTGRLKGKAIQSARDLSLRLMNETRFVVWDRDYLLDLARGTHPDFPLRDVHAAIEKVVAETQLGTLGNRSLLLGLEQAIQAAPISASQLYISSLEATFVITALRRAKMHMHVPLVAAHLARLAAAAEGTVGSSAYEEALDIYRASVDALLERFTPGLASASTFMNLVGGEMELWFTYHATCLLLGEFIATAYFHARRLRDTDACARYSESLGRLVENQPGTRHPVSDRYAVSTFSICAALASMGKMSLLDEFVLATTNWYADLMDDDGVGIAGPYAVPSDEIAHLFGARLSSVDVQRRQQSLLAVALIEVANKWLPCRYPDVLNDLLAVGVRPSAVISERFPRALFLKTGGTSALLNPDYPDSAGTLPWHAREEWASRDPIATAPEAPFVFATACRDRLFQGTAFRLLALA